MKAVGKYIVLKEIKENTTTTKGGLVLGENHREDIRYRKGDVVSVGEMVNGVKDKDNIYYDRHAGLNLEIDTQVFKVIKEQDVVIVL